MQIFRYDNRFRFLFILLFTPPHPPPPHPKPPQCIVQQKTTPLPSPSPLPPSFPNKCGRTGCCGVPLHNIKRNQRKNFRKKIENIKMVCMTSHLWGVMGIGVAFWLEIGQKWGGKKKPPSTRGSLCDFYHAHQKKKNKLRWCDHPNRFSEVLP